MYPTGCVPPKFYGLPKIHKTGNPLKPIVSSRGTVSYRVVKVLSNMLKPMVGGSPITYKVPASLYQRPKGLLSNWESALHLMMSLHFSHQFP